MGEVEIRIIGDAGIQQMLEELPARVQSRILKPLMQAGAKMLADAERSGAPRDSGLLENSLGTSKLSSYRSGNVLFVTAGVRRGFRRAVTAKARGGLRVRSKKYTIANPGDAVRDPAKYLHLVTGGRKAVQASKAPGLYSAASDRYFGKRVAATTPNPFVTRAFDSAQSAVVSMITERAAEGITAEAAKTGG
jgi:hypothetical protein